MRRASTRLIAKLLAAVLLLAQLSIAAYACPGRGPAAGAMAMDAAMMADTGAAASDDAQAMPHCNGMAAALDPDAANLCAEHCKAGQQSHEVPAVSVPMPLLNALYALPLVPVPVPPARPGASTLDALVAASAPLAVMHCVYRF